MSTALAGSILSTGPRGKSPYILHDWITQVKRSRSVMSDSAILWTGAYHAPPSTAFPGKSTGLGCHSLLLDNPERVSKANQNESVALQWPVIPRPGGGHSKNGAVGEELAGRVPTLLPFERPWGAARATWWRRAWRKRVWGWRGLQHGGDGTGVRMTGAPWDISQYWKGKMLGAGPT